MTGITTDDLLKRIVDNVNQLEAVWATLNSIEPFDPCNGMTKTFLTRIRALLQSKDPNRGQVIVDFAHCNSVIASKLREKMSIFTEKLVSEVDETEINTNNLQFFTNHYIIARVDKTNNSTIVDVKASLNFPMSTKGLVFIFGRNKDVSKITYPVGLMYEQIEKLLKKYDADPKAFENDISKCKTCQAILLYATTSIYCCCFAILNIMANVCATYDNWNLSGIEQKGSMNLPVCSPELYDNYINLQCFAAHAETLASKTADITSNLPGNLNDVFNSSTLSGLSDLVDLNDPKFAVLKSFFGKIAGKLSEKRAPADAEDAQS